MERERLIKTFKILLVVLVMLLILISFVLPKLKDEELMFGKNEEGISTNIPFDASDYDNGKKVQDYTNPTDEEKREINSQYGSGYNYFDEEGLHLVNMTDLIEGEEDKLITDKWPEHEFTNSILKPEMEVFEIEVAETYLKIYVKNVDEDDMEDYIDAIKKEYSTQLVLTHPNTLYRASSEERNIVDIKFHKAKSQGVIEYYFD